ncbi:sensor histidine kinase [Sphingobium amiense]|nr:sensor histidine kinase [Sphingobium amiense]
MPDSIFGRLRLLLVAVFSVGAFIATMAAWTFSAAAAADAYDRLLLSAATQLSDAIGVEQGRITALPPDSVFETLSQSTGDRFFFAVRAPDGRVLDGYPDLKVASSAPGNEAAVFNTRNFAGASMRTVTIHRLIASPSGNGWCSVVVAQTLDARHRLVVRLMLKIGATILFVGTLGFIASLYAIGRALVPFDRIGDALAERRPQDTAPLVIESPREIQALVGAINEALRRLHDRMNKLQRFAGIAAHQIRTPLSALGAQTELLLTDRTSAARAKRVERLRKHIATLSRLTNQLLGHAMVSYRSERVPHEKVELVSLIHQVLRDAVPESLDRDISIDFAPIEKELYVEGDAISLREALVNLVSNAVLHGAASLLSVRLTAEEKHAAIAVLDDGPGIPAQLWPSVVQPFHAVREEGEGVGLGLAIVADIARAHGGELMFGRDEKGLFSIGFTVPLLPDEGEAA